nr:DapH/DapD/GlmU-related protein [Youngiibacter multivorans]
MWKLRGEVPVEYLKKMGLKVGSNFHKQYGCIIDSSHCWLISIGDNVTLAPNVHILAHDASTKMYLDYTKIGLVSIGNNVFIGAGSIILPNVSIGSNVVIGAGSVVSRSIPDNSLVLGNPAKVIGSVDDYIERQRTLLNEAVIYDESWTINNITETKKEKMIGDLKNRVGFIK